MAARFLTIKKLYMIHITAEHSDVSGSPQKLGMVRQWHPPIFHTGNQLRWREYRLEISSPLAEGE